MRKSRFTDEQVIGFIKQADAGMSVADLCRRHGWGWYLHTTDRAPKDTLHDIWVSTGAPR